MSGGECVGAWGMVTSVFARPRATYLLLSHVTSVPLALQPQPLATLASAPSLQYLEHHESSLGLLSYAVSQPSLEQVFLAVAGGRVQEDGGEEEGEGEGGGSGTAAGAAM